MACLLSVLELMDQGHYDRLWSDLSERKPLKDFLLQLFSVLLTVARQGEHIFPFTWRTMHCAVNRVMLATLDHLTQPLLAYFLDSGCFDSKVFFTFTIYFFLHQVYINLFFSYGAFCSYGAVTLISELLF